MQKQRRFVIVATTSAGGKSPPLSKMQVVGTVDLESRPYVGAEARLADYWRARTGLDWSDFDIFDKSKQRPTFPLRVRHAEIDLNLSDARGRVGDLITLGFPLSRLEYYFAIAHSFLLTEMPYEVFYKAAWYENEEERGYGWNPDTRKRKR